MVASFVLMGILPYNGAFPYENGFLKQLLYTTIKHFIRKIVVFQRVHPGMPTQTGPGIISS